MPSTRYQPLKIEEPQVEWLAKTLANLAACEVSMETVSRLLPGIEFRSYAGGSPVIEQDEPGREMFLISKGQVRVTRQDKVIAALGPGDFFGEISLVVNSPRFATVAADTDCEIFSIPAGSLKLLSDHCPGLVEAIQTAAIKRLDELAKKGDSR